MTDEREIGPNDRKPDDMESGREREEAGRAAVPPAGSPPDSRQGSGSAPGQPRPMSPQPPQGAPGQPRPVPSQPSQGAPGQPRPISPQPSQGAPGQPRPMSPQPSQGAPGQPRPMSPQGAPGQPRPMSPQPPQGAPGQPRPAGGMPGQSPSGSQPVRKDASPTGSAAAGTSAPPKRPDSSETEKIEPRAGQGQTQKISDPPAATPVGATTERNGASRAGARTAARAGASSTTPKTGEEIPDGKEERVSPAERAAGRRSRAIKFVVLSLSLIAVLFAVYLQTRDRDEAANNNNNNAAPLPQSTDGAAKVGEPVEKANLSATVLKVDRNFSHPDPAIKPADGRKFVVVEFRLTNKDTKAVAISAARQFKLRDSTQTRYDISPTGAPDPKFPDGTVAPGQTISGWIAFQVPVEAKGLRLLFDPSVPV